MSSIIEQRDLAPEEQEELGLTEYKREPHLNEDSMEWIATAAYYMWINDGCPDGDHLNHWDNAYSLFIENHLKNRHRHDH